MQLFMKMTGFSMADRESDLEMPRINPSYADNMTFFLTHDTKAARDHVLDVDALKGRPMAVGAGTTSRDLWIHVCAEQLAARLELPLSVFPGGHNGYAFHPRGFSAKLDEVLRTSKDPRVAAPESPRAVERGFSRLHPSQQGARLPRRRAGNDPAFIVAALPWDARLVGNPENGMIHGGVVRRCSTRPAARRCT